MRHRPARPMVILGQRTSHLTVRLPDPLLDSRARSTGGSESQDRGARRWGQSLGSRTLAVHAVGSTASRASTASGAISWGDREGLIGGAR